MVEQELAIGVLQLVALALPAFAIFLQLVVESDKPYIKYGIPVTTTAFLLFLVGGIIVLGQLVVITPSTIFALALGLLSLCHDCLARYRGCMQQDGLLRSVTYLVNQP